MRVLVCGGRDYDRADTAQDVLDAFHADNNITQIIQGGATGADALAFYWARNNSIPCETVRADWWKHGRAAGNNT